MVLLDNILLALESLKTNKLRSFLTMLGIIIGIGSVIAISTVGSSLKGYISDSMSSIGGSSITVSLTQKSSDSDENKSDSSVKVKNFIDDTPSESDLITDDMISEYRSSFKDNIKYIEKTYSCSSASYDDDNSLNVTGTNDEYQDAEDIDVLYGRYIKNSSDENRKLAVVADEFVENCLNMSARDAVGEKFTVTIDDTPYTFYIAGIYKFESETATTDSDESENQTTDMYIPLDTAREISSSGSGYQSITIITCDDTDVSSFMDTTADFFKSFYTHNDSWSVEATSMQQVISTVTDMISTVSYAIAAIAAISLLVGGIGVMNIMLVSITERTREIGTRKALGAPNSSIRLQFVTEAVVICLAGGIIGVALGIALGSAISNALGYTASPNVLSIVLAVGFSMLIGIVFGYAPANKAARLDPVDALRYE